MPEKKTDIETMAKTAGTSEVNQLHFAYVLGQKSWFGVLNANGQILGYTYSK